MALVGLLGAGAATGWMPLELLPSQLSADDDDDECGLFGSC